jgi:hypothetical protein
MTVGRAADDNGIDFLVAERLDGTADVGAVQFGEPRRRRAVGVDDGFEARPLMAGDVGGMRSGAAQRP